MSNTEVFVTCADGFLDRAKSLAEHIGIPLRESAGEGEIFLFVDENGVSLSDGKLSLRGDFSTLAKRIKRTNLGGEMLVRAAKIKGEKAPLKIIDATAGLGEDSFLLAAAGNDVTLFEKDRIISALLSDALSRAREDGELSAVAERMTLVEGDSIESMKNIQGVDVILLDPMFPERQKSGLIKKKFQLLQRLESPCTDEKELLEAAIGANPRRIVIKRPAKGPFLAGRRPDYTLPGKAIRYDCIAVQNNETRKTE